jgi:polar amino acid transport system ATP-binding protein
VIRVRNLDKSFGELQVLKRINLTVSPSEVVVVIGASGSGKSTMLRCINFLEKPDKGTIMRLLHNSKNHVL